MRLPLASPVESRDGTSNKDERLTNVLSETDEGSTLAVIRPGLTTVATSSGNGSGVTGFNGDIVMVFGTSLSIGDTVDSIGSVVSGQFDFAQSTL